MSKSSTIRDEATENPKSGGLNDGIKGWHLMVFGEERLTKKIKMCLFELFKQNVGLVKNELLVFAKKKGLCALNS